MVEKSIINKYLPLAFEKWKTYINQFSQMEELRKEVSRIKYSDNFAFELEKFDGRKFKTKISLHDNPESLHENYFTYSFNKKGLPLIEDSRHVFNKMYWSAYFLYHPYETVYVQYSHAHFFPERLEWIEWKNGKKIAVHRFGFHSTGQEYSNKMSSDIVTEALTNKRFPLSWSVEIFTYDGKEERIISSNYTYYSTGWGFYGHVKHYQYNEQGKLQTIERVSHTIGNAIVTEIEYSRPPKGESLQSLTEALAEQFANAILDDLQREKSDTPIALVDMSYRSVQNYKPHVEYATDNELRNFQDSTIYEPSEQFSGITWMKHQIEWQINKEIEFMYARFFSYIDNTANWNAGRKFMYLVAKKINMAAKTIGKPMFSQSFFAYTLDYEIDTDMENIFIKCGATGKQVKEWKKEGKL